MSWARSFYLRERSSLYRHRRIVSSRSCSEWSFWSFSSKMSKMSIMLAMLTVITSDSSDQSDHFEILITQWLSNHCCLCNHARKSSNTEFDRLYKLQQEMRSIEFFTLKCMKIIFFFNQEMKTWVWWHIFSATSQRSRHDRHEMMLKILKNDEDNWCRDE